MAFRTWRHRCYLGLTFILALAGCTACSVTHVKKPTAYTTTPDISHFSQRGEASQYSRAFQGQRTASGERYQMKAFTAAHRTLPFSSYVLVTNLKNGKRVIVRINDRGPFHSRRIIDLSQAAARALNLKGVGRVEIRGLSAPQAKAYSRQ